MMRNTAISFSLCLQNISDKVEALILLLNNDFSIIKEEHLELITIRHYTDEMLQEMKRGKLTLMEERLKDTVQLVVKDLPGMQRRS
jgi:aspartate kinase